MDVLQPAEILISLPRSPMTSASASRHQLRNGTRDTAPQGAKWGQLEHGSSKQLVMTSISKAIVDMLALMVVRVADGRIVGANVGVVVAGRIAVNIHGSGAVTDMGQ